MFDYNVYALKAERNCTTRLNRATRTIYSLCSNSSLSLLEQMRLIADCLDQATTKQW